MKKILTLFLLLSSFAFYGQEVPRQKVIVEVGTGTWCPSCPAVVAIIHDLIADGANMSVVEYHINDPYQTQGAIARQSYYNFPWYPTTYYDGWHIGFDDWATYSVHESYYLTRSATLSSFSVAIDGEVGSSEANGTVTIDKVANFSGTNLKLHVVLTESNIPEIWQGETELDFTERAMFPSDGNGFAIDFTSGSSQEIDFTVPIDPTWVRENCELVFFVQDDDTKEVLQGDAVLLDDIILSNADNVSQSRNSYFYPNPAKNQLFLYAEDFTNIEEISIIDMLGKTVLEQSAYTQAIDIDRLPQGVYLISYIENDEKKSAKIVKE